MAFTVFSALCAVAPNGPTLVGVRLLEGLVGGCGVAVGRAVISDRYEGAAAAARFGTLSAIVFLGPVLAPAIGGVILTVGDWRSVFVFLAAVGALMVTGVVLGIPETLPPERRHVGGLVNTLGRMKDLLHDRAFLGPVVVQCFATAGFFTYIGGSSFVLQDQLHFSQREYTVLFASNAAGMVVASTIFSATVARVGPAVLRNAGLVLSTAAAAALAAHALIRHPDRPVTAVDLGAARARCCGDGIEHPRHHGDRSTGRPALGWRRGSVTGRADVRRGRPGNPADRTERTSDRPGHGRPDGGVPALLDRSNAGQRRSAIMTAPLSSTFTRQPPAPP